MRVNSRDLMEAVLWDFDGTLIDTEPVWVSCEIEMLAEWSVPWTREQGYELSGMNWKASTEILRAHSLKHGFSYEGEDAELYRDLVDRVVAHVADHELPWRPGVPQLLEELSENGIPMAIVSASPRRLLDAGLARMPHVFDVVVDGSQVVHGKPDPEGYLLAAHRLGVEISNSLVIEDSVSGSQAGYRAGATVIAVPSVHPIEKSEQLTLIDSLEGVDLAALTTLWHQGKDRR